MLNTLCRLLKVLSSSYLKNMMLSLKQIFLLVILHGFCFFIGFTPTPCPILIIWAHPIILYAVLNNWSFLLKYISMCIWTLSFSHQFKITVCLLNLPFKKLAISLNTVHWIIKVKKTIIPTLILILYCSVVYRRFFFIFIVDTIIDVPSPPTHLLPTLTPLPTGRHHTVVCVYGCCKDVLWLIPSPSFIQSPSPLPSDSCQSVPCIHAPVSILCISFHICSLMWSGDLPPESQEEGMDWKS